MTTGSTTRSRELRLEVLRDEPICWLRLPGCTIRSTTGDHVIPISLRPEGRYVRSNCRGACRRCNFRRGNLPVSALPQLRAQLTRAQLTPDATQQPPRPRRRPPAPALNVLFGPKP